MQLVVNLHPTRLFGSKQIGFISGRSSVGRTLHLGCRGREFKSRRSEAIKIDTFTSYGCFYKSLSKYQNGVDYYKLPYIYVITNEINKKVYVGKTLKTIDKRWKQHCRDYKKNRNCKRPLYSAMRKYGIENFSIREIEECDSDIASERESFWINKFNSFKNGYNATKGGDGKPYIDRELIISEYNNGFTIKDVSKITGYSESSCGEIINSIGLSKDEIHNRANKFLCKPVAKIDLNTNEILEIYNSISEAYEQLGKKFSGHIAEVCEHKRKSAYGYSWSYVFG